MDEGTSRRMVQTFVELADTLASDYDVGEFLQLLAHRCVDVLDATVGGVLLEQGGELALAAATSDAMDKLERWELEQEEGPCYDAYRRVEQVVAPDLATASDRWPGFAPKATEMGLHAALAFPLRLRDDCIGALNLYLADRRPFGDEAVGVGQAFADVAAIGILQERAVSDAERRAGQLQQALTSRLVIEQAKGILAERYGIGLEEAFDALRRFSRAHRVKVHDVARRITTNEGMDEFHAWRAYVADEE